ncbi:hypothetical protein CBQ26_14455 [Deinococcus indicus]|uniref:DUF2834 domain-containing protein n=1 Tax=Deinococcus indicus TaxID=223556 RepID=A0A246BHH9_9DEIO|nr:hypothetical protein [Deinococcus indicus]OWL94717.1 hypothetical protein CBQ26_14455 [Deinococcus indicus]
MTWITVAPLIAGALTFLFAVTYALSRRTNATGPWIIPAVLAALFLGFSLYAGVNEGATGFWPEHVRNLWGNQIWFDLLLAASVALYLLIPKARALGINPLPWAVLSVATGSIGLLAFLSFVLWKQGRLHSMPSK